VTEPARAGVNEDGELPGEQPERIRGFWFEDFIYPLNLQEVVAAPEPASWS